MRVFDTAAQGLCDLILKNEFGNEWTNLDHERRRLVLQDFMEAIEYEDLAAHEYRRRIGVGNLESYGDVMLARERNGWD